MVLALLAFLLGAGDVVEREDAGAPAGAQFKGDHGSIPSFGFLGAAEAECLVVGLGDIAPGGGGERPGGGFRVEGE